MDSSPHLNKPEARRGNVSGVLAVAVVLMTASARAQTLYSIGAPTNEQQSMVELINRARANGGAEALRLGLSSLQEGSPSLGGEPWLIANAVQPLSWNSKLFNAAQNQADILNNGDQFFSGQSPHTYPNGTSSPQQRITTAGYSMDNYNGPTTASGFIPGPENVAESESFGSGPFTGLKLVAAVLTAHNDLFTDGNTTGRGHRCTTMLGFFREIGIGVSGGTDVGPDGNNVVRTWDSLYIVQNFGAAVGQIPFITGVVYHDKNGNGFYDPGEGIGGVRVDVAGSSFYAVTASSGGYSVPVPGNGSYSITFSGSSVATAQGTALVANLLNAKVDYLTDVLAGVVGIARSNTDIVVNFQATTGQMYRLERKLALTQSTWNSIPTVADLTAPSGGVMPLTDPGAINSGMAFYRVRLLP